MDTSDPSEVVGPSDVAQILTCLSQLMDTLHKSDLALQNAMSALARNSEEKPDMVQLQHVDLLTQTHCDLAKMLAVLASSLRTDAVMQDDLKNSLSLRSLQDTLLGESETSGANTVEAGELSLF